MQRIYFLIRSAKSHLKKYSEMGATQMSITKTYGTSSLFALFRRNGKYRLYSHRDLYVNMYPETSANA